MKRIIIGIAGGTGSGKTTIAARISSVLGSDRIVVIPQDMYYQDQSHLPLEVRAKVNYDHPSAFDTELLLSHLKMLKEGHPIERPTYDFVIHARSKKTVRIEPRDVIIVEGILVLYYPELRELMDIKIYVDTPDDIRFIRRLKRDTAERGRTIESVIEQYIATVRPMHMEFVEPSKQFADVIIPEGGYNDIAIEMVVSTVLRRLSA